MKQEEITEGNKLIAEFTNEGFWQIWKVGGYKPHWTNRYSSKEEAQSVIDSADNGKGEKYLVGYAEPKYVFKEYHSSWDWLHPVYRKVAEIGLWMMTNGHDKLWLEKSKEIEYAMLNEETPERASQLIAQIIQYYNTQKSKTE